MADLFDKVTGDQDPITKLAGKIPGFKGYVERQSRRAADKLLREQIADRYEELWTKAGHVQQELISEGEITLLDDIETSVTKLRTFIDKIKNASYGYSGFFDAVKINEEELAAIYQFDMAMMDGVEAISAAIDNVETSIGTDGLSAAVRHLKTLARDLVTTFEKRDEVLTATE